MLRLYKTLVGPKMLSVIDSLPPTSQLVLLYARCLSVDPVNRPSIRRLLRVCPYSRRTVRDAYRDLVSGGWWVAEWLRGQPLNDTHLFTIHVGILVMLHDQVGTRNAVDLIRLLCALDEQSRFSGCIDELAEMSGLDYRRTLALLDMAKRNGLIEHGGTVVPLLRRKNAPERLVPAALQGGSADCGDPVP